MRLSIQNSFVLRRLALGLMFTLNTSFTLASNADENKLDLHEIKAPYYGDTLFQFFQDHYFASVTNLMVSQHFGRVAGHTEEAEVLRGGILLSYGLQREAAEIFKRLIALGARPPTRDRAWFYLAKISYQRGYLAEAEDAITRIANALPADLKEERELLQANLLMARGDYAAAATVLGAMDLKAAGSRYARYNLGIALMKSNQVATGTKVLDELGRAPAENEEFRSLRDRANVALGFSAIADKQPQLARNYLERVRLKSQQANKALLGLGWAAASMKDPKLALVPWLELAGRDLNDSAVLEAQIAVPYAYAELGANSQSARRYEQAISAFSSENTNLTESIAAIKSGKLVDALITSNLASNPGEEMGWFWTMRELPAMPHASHLGQILAQHEFQEAFKNYRDLRFLQQNLEEWRDKLGVFEDMLENRRKAFAERLPQVLDQTKDIGLTSLQTRQVTATQVVTVGENAADGVAFANTKQLDLLERAASVQNALKDATDVPDLDTGRERARLAAGVLTWQLAQDFPARLWRAKKELQEIAELIQNTQQLDAALAQAQRDEPARFGAFAKRIAAMTSLLQVMIPRVATLRQEQQLAVQNIAVNELARLQERLTAYATQARFALAQLYDRGNVGGKGGGKGDAKAGDKDSNQTPVKKNQEAASASKH
jgi:hypothetical protein